MMERLTQPKDNKHHTGANLGSPRSFLEESVLMRAFQARVLCGLTWSVLAASSWGGGTVYRCPGPPVLYTDTISANEAKTRGCRTIEGAPVTVIQGGRLNSKPRSSPSTDGLSISRGSGSGGVDAKVDPVEQRNRDSDAKRILQAELDKSEEQLAGLRKEFNNGEPERRGDERNFTKYQDRVAEMKAAIARKESDVASLKREIAR
jgi:hypothetical protein